MANAARVEGVTMPMLLVAIGLAFAGGEVLPYFQLETLNGHRVSLPEDARGRTTLLIVGFSKASQTPCRAWGERFTRDFGVDPRYGFYSVAVLEGVPRLVRGMVTGGMRKSIPAEKQDRFLLEFQDRNGWKRVMGAGGTDDAFYALLDRDGAIRWRGHGVFLEGDYARLREQMRQLSPQ